MTLLTKPLPAMSRRTFLTIAAVSPFAPVALKALGAAAAKPPVGLELWTVRDELTRNLMGTIRAVARMGYEVVEFYAPYYQWTPQVATDVRKLLDDLGIRCHSTHNSDQSFTPGGIQKAIDLNQIIGSTYIVMASTNAATLDQWKAVCDRLNVAAEKLKPLGMFSGFHNHQTEWRRVDNQRPMDVIAANTVKDVVLQFDVGTCVEVGEDPVAWIKANPGRIKSMHCKDWGRGSGKGYGVLFGEGDSPWPGIFEVAESTGGLEYYLIEQEEGPAAEQLQRAERCLANWKKMRGSESGGRRAG
jgi:sugar phosphate isomerase/epimerase